MPKTDLSQLSTRALNTLIKFYQDKIATLEADISFRREMIDLSKKELQKRACAKPAKPNKTKELKDFTT